MSAIGPCLTLRPWLITTTSSAVWETSASTWLETSTALPSFASCLRKSRSQRMPCGSRPLAGSSRTRTFGSPSIAAALLGEPELLILDEPANGLDPEGVRWLRDFLRAYAAEGRTVFVSSHVLAEVAQTVDQVLIINRGRLVVESPLAELTARVGGAVRVRTPRQDDLVAKLRAEGLEPTETADGTLLVPGTGRERVGDLAFAAGIPVHELATEGASLEEVFLELTADAAETEEADA